MLYLILIIVSIIVFIKINNLNSRISLLESKYFTGKEAIKSEPVLDNLSQSVTSDIGKPVTPNEVTYSPTAFDKFISWLKDDWMLKLGGFLLLIGLGWFTTYAIMNNWIGEFGRITLGIFVGVLILGLGSWRIIKYINQGGIFLVVGSAIILLTIFAAREFYDMFTPIFALILMFLSSAYISLISIKYNSFAVSFSGLVLALIAPLLINNSQTDQTWLFSYLFVVTLGAIWIVVLKKNWGSLILASLVGVFFHSLSSDSDSLIWFAYAFAAVFFITSVISIIKSREGDIKAFLWTAIANGAFLLFWIIGLVSAEWQSLVISLWMIIFAVGAFLVFNITKIRSVFYVYAGVALAMLLVATSIELKGDSSVIAYTVESFLVPILIYFTTKEIKASTISLLLIIWPTFLSLANLGAYSRNQVVFSKNFFVIFLIILLFMVLGLLYKKIKKVDIEYSFYPDNLLLIIGSVYGYILLWSALHVGIDHEATAVTFCLVIFTIIGLIKYFYGISIGSKILRNYGGILVGFVILRLLFVDIWDMEIGTRVVVFILIGVLLMSTAFISRQIKSGFDNK